MPGTPASILAVDDADPRIAHYVLVEIALSQPACEPRDRAVQDALALRDRPVHEIQDRNEKEKRSRRRDTDDAIAEESLLVLGKSDQETTLTSPGGYDRRTLLSGRNQNGWEQDGRIRDGRCANTETRTGTRADIKP